MSAMEGHRFAVIVAHRRAGKTEVMVLRLLLAAMFNARSHPAPNYAYIAPLLKQAKDVAWGRLKHYARGLPEARVHEGDLKITLWNRAVIGVFGADNPDALRGAGYDGVVMDEVAQMKADTWPAVVRPALSDRQGWAVFIGTPKGQNAFYDLYHAALNAVAPAPGPPALNAGAPAPRPPAGAEGPRPLNPGPSLARWTGKGAENKEPAREVSNLNPAGAEGPGALHRDWFAGLYPLDRTGVLPAEETASLLATMPPDLYRQEYLCDFTAANSDSFIDFVSVHEARRRPAPLHNPAPLVFGLDVARFGDDRTVLVRRRGLVVEDISITQGQDLMRTAAETAQAINLYRPQAVFIDAVGLGAGVADRLRELGHAVIGVNSGARAARPDLHYNLKAEMWAKMRDWLTAGGAVLPDHPAIPPDLTAPRYEFDFQGRLKIESKDELKARGTRSPDCADALALTFALPVAATGLGPGLAAGAGAATAAAYESSLWR